MNKLRPRHYFAVLTLLIFQNNLSAQKLITKRYYGSNKIEEQYQVNNLGQKNGFYKYYHSDGHLLYFYQYKNDEEHGLCIDYAGTRNWQAIYCYGKPLLERVMANGKIQSEKYYGCANNTNYLIEKKKLISPDIYEKVTYYENGKIKEKFKETSSGVKAKGLYEKYHVNGKLAEKGMFDEGEIGNWIGYYENGDTLYFAKYEVGVQVILNKYFQGNKIESRISIDDQFDHFSKIYYYPNGNLKSVENCNTYPFKYECGSKDDPKSPQNWKQLAEKGIICAGKSYNPFNNENNYTESVKTYNESGELVSELYFVLRNNNGRFQTFEKNELEFEDSLWSRVQSNKSAESFASYFEKSKLSLYKYQVGEIYERTYKELKTQVGLLLNDCARNDCIDNQMLEKAQQGFRIQSVESMHNLEELKVVLGYLNNPQNTLEKETKESIDKAQNISEIKRLLGL